MIWGVGFAALCVWQSVRPSRWCGNKVLQYLGERSYSIYLLHPIVIVLLKNPIQVVYAALTPYLSAYAFFVCAALFLVPLLILTELAYRLIEVPGIGLGKRINSRLRERSSASPSHLQNVSR